MKEDKKNKRIIYIYILLGASIICSVFLKLLPYILYNHDFLIGFDSGKYIYDMVYKLSTNPFLINLWVEPGLNTNLIIIDTVINKDPIFYYKIMLPVLVSINLILVIYLLTVKLTNSPLIGVFSSFYFSISSIFLNVTFDSYYRQLIGTIIFMVLFYFIDKTYKTGRMELRYIIMFIILGAGIIISHRAVSMLYIILWLMLFFHALIKKNFIISKQLLAILIASMALASIYWVSILKDNITVIKDTFIMSLSGQHGGATQIKVLKRIDNQLVGYLTLLPTAFFSVLGIFYLILRRKFNLFTIFTAFLLVYIMVKATFSNRFLINLEILFSISAGVFLFYLNKHFSKKLLISIAIISLVLNFTYSANISINRKPYISIKTDSIQWIEKNIDKKTSLIIAPDALATILGQLGYRASIYEYKPKPNGIDSLQYTEDFLISGYEDTVLLQDMSDEFDNTYVILSDWNIKNPLTKTGIILPLEEWDSSPLFEKMLESDDSVRRVYRLKTSGAN